MKIALLLIGLLGFLGVVAYTFQKSRATEESVVVSVKTADAVLTEKSSQSPVLIELFTSEGCSSCPLADRNLAELEKQPNVIALGFHVDYWNSLGWTDRFSKAEYTERQSFYSKALRTGPVYTPQMVVDGSYQFIGGNIDEANKTIDTAKQNPKGTVILSLTGDNLKVSINTLPAHSLANVFLAVAEDNLSTNVKNGENDGKTLNHAAVVRDLKAIGSVAADAQNFETETILKIPADWEKQNLKYIVFVQTENDSKIIAVNQIKS